MCVCQVTEVFYDSVILIFLRFKIISSEKRYVIHYIKQEEKKYFITLNSGIKYFISFMLSRIEQCHDKRRLYIRDILHSTEKFCLTCKVRSLNFVCVEELKLKLEI